MDWERLRRPVGPLPSRVYWYRRVWVLGVALGGLALFGVLVGVGMPRSQPAGRVTFGRLAGQTPSPGASTVTRVASSPVSDGTGPTTSSSSPALSTCPQAQLSLEVHTSAESYPAGVTPAFTTTLRNAGPACVAPGPLALTVRSGGDRIWSSTDCASAAGPSTDLASGGTAGASRVWTRTRSQPGCQPGGPAALPGTYRVSATWAGATSPETSFQLR